MSRYGRVYSQFWTGTTGKELRSAGPEVQLLALYLITNPHANMIGFYYLPTGYISHDTGLERRLVGQAFTEFGRIGFARYDDTSEHVWVVEMARFQVLDNGTALKNGDTRVKTISKLYAELPDNPFLRPFFDQYHEAFHLAAARGGEAGAGQDRSIDGPSPMPSPIDAPSMPRRSQEQVQVQVQEEEPHTLRLSPDGDRAARVPEAARGRRGKGSTNKSTGTDPRVALVLARFDALHRQFFGVKYPIKGARDAQAIRALPNGDGGFDRELLLRCLESYFADRDSRHRYGADIPQFVKRLSRIARDLRTAPDDRATAATIRAHQDALVARMKGERPE